MEETIVGMQETTLPEVESAEESSAVVETAEAADSAEVATPSTETEQDGEATEESVTDEGEEGDEPESPPVVRVKFNKQERAYTTEEAAPLVEMGLKWDSFKESHEKLKFLALTHGKSVGELVDLLINSNDKMLYQQTLAECGGNEAVANKLFDVQRSERQRKYAEAKTWEQEQARREEQQEVEQLQNRLADEFVLLAREMPGKFTQFADVPAAVVESAIKDKVSLLDAYLRFEHREGRKSEAVRMKQADAAKRSTGSLNGEQQLPEPDLDSFERAFQNALR